MLKFVVVMSDGDYVRGIFWFKCLLKWIVIMKHWIIHSRSQGLIDYAYRFAKEAHDGQERKYTVNQYIF